MKPKKQTQEEKINFFLEQHYGIVNADGTINLRRFFDDYYNAIAYSRAFKEVPIFSIPKRNVSRLNPHFDAYLDDSVLRHNKNIRKSNKKISIKKMANEGLLSCSICGSNKFLDEQQVLLCLGCRNVELKKNILISKNSKIVIRSKNYQFAKRCRILFEEWKLRLPSKQVRIKLERYALKDYEQVFIKIMRRSLKSRVELIKIMNIGIETNIFSDKKHNEKFNYNKKEYKTNAKAYEIMQELNSEGEISE